MSGAGGRAPARIVCAANIADVILGPFSGTIPHGACWFRHTPDA